ncbi:transposase IS3/IS911 [Rhodopseudomonas palustris BisB18]|uniref:Transposase IS3/IS911 n=2 Tax=Rhodopseudomonas palustris TaxID=1076 RepID=Q21D22_RHOPB
MDTVDSAITKPVRRPEVFTGAGRRRAWSDEDKARLVAEIEISGDSVSGVARRHGLSPQQLFGWEGHHRSTGAISKRNALILGTNSPSGIRMSHVRQGFEPSARSQLETP